MQYRIGRALRRQYGLAADEPIPLSIAREAGYLLPEDLAALDAGKIPPSSRVGDAGSSVVEGQVGDLKGAKGSHALAASLRASKKEIEDKAAVEARASKAAASPKPSTAAAMGDFGGGAPSLEAPSRALGAPASPDAAAVVEAPPGAPRTWVAGKSVSTSAMAGPGIAVVGQPPFVRRGRIGGRWAELEAAVEAALWAGSPEPNFYGAPEDPEASAAFYDGGAQRALFFDSDEEHERDLLWWALPSHPKSPRSPPESLPWNEAVRQPTGSVPVALPCLKPLPSTHPTASQVPGGRLLGVPLRPPGPG